MITPDELRALVELLNRCPMTAAERFWVQSIINKLAPPVAQPETEEEADA